VQVRGAYQRNPINKPAITSFIGTVNNIGGVLNDASGNRRFMATTILSIDFDYTKIDVNQVWAQAYAMYKAGEPWNLVQDESILISQTNENFETETPVIDLINKKFTVDQDNRDWFVTSLRIIEILRESGFTSHSPTGAAMMVSTAAKKMGLRKGVKRNSLGEAERGYFGMREKSSI
jgi:predicted P-loop ATPase